MRDECRARECRSGSQTASVCPGCVCGGKMPGESTAASAANFYSPG